MDSDHQSAAVQQFCAVTASAPEQALFFLESCNWHVDSAIHSFYESTGGDHEEALDLLPVSENTRSIPQLQEGNAEIERVVPAAGNPSRPDRMTGKSKRDKPAARVSLSSGGGGIKTLSDLNRQQESDSDSDGPQEYYTGGEKSGMMVQDPSKGQREVDSIFDRARQFGAREGQFETPSASSSRGVFSGTGRTLAGDDRQDQGQGHGVGAGSRPLEPVIHTITFWRNGFTVDDGPLRRFEDQENAPFLKSINRGECPSELEPEDRNIAVHVNLVKRDEEWQPPAEPRYRAFQGTGRTLGSASEPPLESNPLESFGSSISPDMNTQPFQGLVIDDLKPSTSIQLRLSDGTRMVACFNHYHTISDIRSFIDASRPGSSRIYQLQMMGFPPKMLLNPAETVAQAGLLNAVVIQKV